MDKELLEAFDLQETDDAKESEISASTDETMGNIKISVDVVSKIASIAASEIEGVSGMYSSFVEGVAQRLGAKKNASQGVRVDIADNSAEIDLYLVVMYGVKIPELAWNVQGKVKQSVEEMTGLTVEAVNIHIESIDFGTEDSENSIVD